MRRDDALLLDMLIAARKIRTFVQGVGEQDFYRSDLIQSAVLRELQVLGQAARLVTDETRTRLPEVAWREILGLRNRIVHEYFNLNPSIVWQVVQYEIPALIAQLETVTPPDTDS
jgi:uncharacterized protein with HEPN domain